METSNDSSTDKGIYQYVYLPSGEYTFSSYLRIADKFESLSAPGVYLTVRDNYDRVLAKSELLNSNESIYTRISTSFTLDEAQFVGVYILAKGKGKAYINAPQLENKAYAGPYNMLENGSFEYYFDESKDKSWYTVGNVAISNTTSFDLDNSILIVGNITGRNNLRQLVKVKEDKSIRETFTLSGWAKVSNAVCGKDAEFRLRAKIVYKNGVEDYIDDYTADFNPNIKNWQFASVQFCKSEFEDVSNITVMCEYNNMGGTVYFDNIQLTRDFIETGLTNKDGYREYKSNPETCKNCPTRELCTHSKDCVKVVQRHIWKDYEELADDARYTPKYADLYRQRKETIERVFADAKEKHAMRYTHYRGLAQVSNWVRLKFAAMNLKRFAKRKWRDNLHFESLDYLTQFLLFFNSFSFQHKNTHQAKAR